MAPPVRAYRWLVLGLAFFVVTHVLGMLTMATLLRGGMDAFAFDVAARMRYVAEHPWAWRFGWLPWQASALSDVVISVSLARWLATRASRAGLAWVLAALALDLASAIPEQWAEAMLVSTFVDHARAGDLARFGEEWILYTRLTGVWGGGGYTLMTIAWMIAVRRACGRGAWPTWAELALLVVLAVGVALTWQATVDGPEYFAAASAANALAFPMLTLWSLGVATRFGELARRDRPDRSDPAFALRWPEGRALRLLAPLASDGIRDLMRLLSRVTPYPTLRSDVTDVVYVSWMVPIDRVAKLVPEGIAIDVVDGLTPLSILTYRHGRFGPAILGPLRRLFASPSQSNWRLYAAPLAPGSPPETVFFLKNVIDHPLYVIGARLLSDGLPAHLPARMHHTRNGEEIQTQILPGFGSAPDLSVTVRESEGRSVPEPFHRLGASFDDVLAYLVPQELAVRTHPAVGLRSESLIVVDPGAIRPATVSAFESEWLAPIVEGCEPFAFVIPRLRFASTGERWHPMR